MAMLQSRTPAGYGSSIASYRVQQPSTQHHGFFASPTESEFSEHFDAPGTVRNWDEERVAEWLRSINCSQYVSLFLKNNITGANLMELDVTALKELGVAKVGDRIRISNQAKNFRTKEYKRISKRVTNRESLALLDNPNFTPPSSASPKAPHSARSQQSTRAEKRMSRQIGDLSTMATITSQFSAAKPTSRPASPYIDQGGSARSRGFGSVGSPHRENTLPSGTKAADFSTIQSRYAVQSRSQTAPVETPQTARFPSHRPSPSTDSSITNSSILPMDKALIRVIYDTGRTSVVSIDGCKNVEEILLKALRKGQLNENHVKSYCFYVLDGTEPNPALCRRINETEVWRVCSDRNRLERNRLILRKIHMGEPDDEQLKMAASIASQIHVQQQQNNLIIPTSARSQLKIEKITGESLAPVSYPLSPASAQERERQIYTASQELQRAAARNKSQIAVRPRTVLKEHFGGRPPSELIASDLSTYFPEYEASEIDRTVRMSIRRSRRISRAASRLSIVSNFSVASSLKDAPPLPAISDQWLNQAQKGPRPLSVLRLGSGFRDSIASSMLEPLDEESPLEPDRKSYVSFAGSEVQVTDPEGNTSMHGYYDDARSSIANSMISGVSGSSGENGDSLNKRLSQAIHEDDEESDEELVEYLEADSWDNIKYMKGALIGQGSFGSVYLALHAVTGELMAVKQVEMPSDVGALDNKKKNMVEALKHEIGLLRELKHDNIVSYLGSNSDESHLNIFLEYVPGGSVATMLVNYGPLGESLITNFVRQILTGLAYLHSKDIIHRDIKGANILVDNKGTVKISDFGISKRVEASSLLTPAAKKGAQRVSLQGSVFWMAPEVVRQTAYTKKADIWSLGCLIVEMLSGQHPHPNCTQMQAIFKIGNKSGNDASPTIPENASAELKEFLGMTFRGEHEMRPSAEELLGSKWITKDLK